MNTCLTLHSFPLPSWILILNEQRLLVVELLSISSEEFPVHRVCWLDELYTGEFDDLCTCHLYSNEVGEPVPPKIEGWKSDSPAEQSNCQVDEEVLQVFSPLHSTLDMRTLQS